MPDQPTPKPFVWTGDLDDDCVCEWGGYLAHAEALSDGLTFEVDDNGTAIDGSQWESQSWWCAVYKGKEQVWSPTDAGGLFGSGELARACCEMFMAYRAESAALRAAVAEAESRADVNLRALRNEERMLELAVSSERLAQSQRIKAEASRDALAAELAAARKALESIPAYYRTGEAEAALAARDSASNSRDARGGGGE